MPESFTFHWNCGLQYLAYVDADTGKALTVEPEQTYRMYPVEPGLPVPPPDGRWTLAVVKTKNKTESVLTVQKGGE